MLDSPDHFASSLHISPEAEGESAEEFSDNLPKPDSLITPLILPYDPYGDGSVIVEPPPEWTANAFVVADVPKPPLLKATVGNDAIYGLNNDDLLFGHGGDDYIVGNGGNDIIYGDDLIIIIPTLDGNPNIPGNDILIGGAGDDFISGRAGNDILSGGTGLDNLSGGTGLDILTGGMGLDTLSGGADADVFVFDNNDGFADVVIDFEIGLDKLDVTMLVASSNTPPVFESTIALQQIGLDTSVSVRTLNLLGQEEFVQIASLSNTVTANLSANDFILQAAPITPTV